MIWNMGLINSVYLSIYCSTVLEDIGRVFRFLIYTRSVELLGRGISPSQNRYLHRTIQTQNKRTQTPMPRQIWTHDPSVRAGEINSCLRQRGHCDHLIKLYDFYINIFRCHEYFKFVTADLKSTTFWEVTSYSLVDYRKQHPREWYYSVTAMRTSNLPKGDTYVSQQVIRRPTRQA
jgi:hypothetical protein